MVSTFPALTAAGLGVITVEPIPDVTPFTIRSGATYESILSGIRVWIRDELVPHLNEHGAEATFQGYIDTMIDAVNSTLGAQAATVTAALNEAVREVVTADIPITAALFDTMGVHIAPPPSGTDDTAALNTWLASVDRSGTLRAATYRISGTLTVPAGVTILGYGSKLTAPTGSFDMVRLGSGSIFRGVELDGTGRTTGCGIVVDAAVGANVLDCYIHDLPGLGANDSAGILVRNASSKYRIAGCRIERVHAQAIMLNASSNGVVTGNQIDTAEHGIQFGGGDSNVTSVIGITHLVLANNIVKNVQGGIWGSLGQFVTVADNDIENCSDVGIDFEGCQDCTASGGTIHNARNACMSVFYYSQRIKFVGITCLNDASNQAGGNGAGFKAFSGKTSTDITVENCEITTVSTAVQTDTAALDVAVFNGLKVTVTQSGVSNAKAFRILDCVHQIDILNCRITCHSSTGISFEGGSDSTIADNRIVTDADASSAGSVNGGILLYARSTTYPTKRNRVKNNTCIGFVQSINDHYGITQDATTANLIESNIAATINHTPVGGTYGGLITNNRKSDLSASTLTTV